MHKLSFSICRRLKEAGFPQENCLLYYHPSNIWMSFCLLASHRYEPIYLACPNSDELLEQIEKINNQRIFLEPFKKGYKLKQIYNNEIKEIESTGNTLTGCLAELYIELKKNLNT